MNERNIEYNLELFKTEKDSKYVISCAGRLVGEHHSRMKAVTPLEQLDILERFADEFKVQDKGIGKVIEDKIELFADFMYACLTDKASPAYMSPFQTMKIAARSSERPDEIKFILRNMTSQDEMDAMQLFLEKASDFGLPDQFMTEPISF